MMQMEDGQRKLSFQHVVWLLCERIGADRADLAIDFSMVGGSNM